MKIRVYPSFTLTIQAQTTLNGNASTVIFLQQAGALGLAPKAHGNAEGRV
jgi:hypothetical protein